MEDKNLLDSVPLGLGMALAQNMDAMERFANLPDEEKVKIIAGAKNVRCKEEMQIYVNNIAKGTDSNPGTKTM